MTHPYPILSYARSHLGVAFIAGGKNRLTGLDSASFVCTVLRSFGVLKPREELTVPGLLKKFASFETRDVVPGALLFFGESGRAPKHVAMAVSPTRMIEAGGGDETVSDFHAAARVGAMVREWPIAFRNDLLIVVMPPWPDETVSKLC